MCGIRDHSGGPAVAQTQMREAPTVNDRVNQLEARVAALERLVAELRPPEARIDKVEWVPQHRAGCPKRYTSNENVQCFCGEVADRA